MNEPAISPNFTIEDIHKIREYDAEKYWSMPTEKFWAEVRADSLYVQEKIKEAREKRLSQERADMSKVV
jgi:hypothetical protein